LHSTKTEPEEDFEVPEKPKEVEPIKRKKCSQESDKIIRKERKIIKKNKSLG